MTRRADHIPAYVDAERLCFELSISADTLERWMKAGRLPPPKTGTAPVKRGAKRTRLPRGPKRLWSWQQVQDWIDGRPRSAPVSHDRLRQEIEDAARANVQGPAHR